MKRPADAARATMPAHHRLATMPALRRLALALLFTVPVVAIGAASAALHHDLTGVWDFAVVTENGTGTPVVRITQERTKLTGTYESGRMGVRSISGSVVGDTLKFVLAAASEGGMALVFVGRVISPDLVRGEVDFQGMGSATFTGTRRKSTP